MRALLVVGLMSFTGCTLATLPEAVFQCEANGSCSQPGFTCVEGLCRAATDAGTVDAGTPNDAGNEPDASVEMDAGQDAGVEVDAGFDAGIEVDAGMDAGMVVDAGFDAGMTMDAGCVPTGAIDEPDQAGLDVDCDGFDGDLSRAVFVDAVNGADTNAGTQLAPKKTLGAAAATSKVQLYLSTGTLTGTVTFTTAVAVFGGYDATNWSRTTTKTVVNGALIAQPASNGRVVFEQLNVTAPQPSTPGAASVALTIQGAGTGSRVTSCRLAGGPGAPGDDGLAAPTVLGGQKGKAGGAGAVAADGGLGGVGVNCGDAGFTLDGFAGGGGAIALPGNGGRGADLTVGGAGGTAMQCTAGPCTGNDGVDGLSGADGTFSSVRPADPSSGLGSISGGQWVGPALGTWTPAEHGKPGGGGGGGGALLDISNVFTVRAGGGGGGGSGGCGGRSGTAGNAGGASMGLVLIDSSPTLHDVQLVSGAGGNGGVGGAAGAGGAGGLAIGGGAGENDGILGTAGRGGAGLIGGRGGPGRQGPGGWGGPVIGLFCSGTSAPVRDATTTWTAGAPGTGGAGDPVGVAGSQPTSGYAVGCP